MIHIYTHIYIYSTYILTKYRERNILRQGHFYLTHITRVFIAESFLLYNNGRFYSVHCIFTSIRTNSDTYSPIKRHIDTYMHIQ